MFRSILYTVEHKKNMHEESLINDQPGKWKQENQSEAVTVTTGLQLFNFSTLRITLRWSEYNQPGNENHKETNY